MTQFYASSKSPEHYTPQYILDRAKWIMGEYHDPALPGKTDGLTSVWTGAIFLNPPYGRGIEKWFSKLRDSVYQGKVREYIVLWKFAPETEAWRILMVHTNCIASPTTRLKFKNEFGVTGSGATFSSALFYYGPSKAHFINAFYDCDIYEQISHALKISEAGAEHP